MTWHKCRVNTLWSDRFEIGLPDEDWYPDKLFWMLYPIHWLRLTSAWGSP